MEKKHLFLMLGEDYFSSPVYKTLKTISIRDKSHVCNVLQDILWFALNNGKKIKTHDEKDLKKYLANELYWSEEEIETVLEVMEKHEWLEMTGGDEICFSILDLFSQIRSASALRMRRMREKTRENSVENSERHNVTEKRNKVTTKRHDVTVERHNVTVERHNVTNKRNKVTNEIEDKNERHNVTEKRNKVTTERHNVTDETENKANEGMFFPPLPFSPSPQQKEKNQKKDIPPQPLIPSSPISLTERIAVGIEIKGSSCATSSCTLCAEENSNEIKTQVEKKEDSVMKKEEDQDTCLDNSSASISMQDEKTNSPAAERSGIITDFGYYVEQFNRICTDLPRCIKLTEARKTHIRTAEKLYGREQLIEAFRIVQESDFLSGRGTALWRANFDWVINKNNLVKILEGTYQNRTQRARKDETDTEDFDYDAYIE